jgi:hypothetical protein
MPTTLPERVRLASASVEIGQFCAEVAIGVGMVAIVFFLMFETGAILTPDVEGITRIFVG